MVDFDSGQRRSDLNAGGVVGTRRGSTGSENAAETEKCHVECGILMLTVESTSNRNLDGDDCAQKTADRRTGRSDHG